jgi:hypothetical protein
MDAGFSSTRNGAVVLDIPTRYLVRYWARDNSSEYRRFLEMDRDSGFLEDFSSSSLADSFTFVDFTSRQADHGALPSGGQYDLIANRTVDEDSGGESVFSSHDEYPEWEGLR